MDYSLKPISNPAVLVMGGSSIIGSTICRKFEKSNWIVGIHYHKNKSLAHKTLSDFECKERGILFQADVRDPKQVNKVFERFQDCWGKLDALIWAVGKTNNTVTMRLTPKQWNDIIQTNLTGLYFCLQAVGPIFQAQKYGSAVILSSLSSEKGTVGQTAYAASKAGILGLVRSVAQEWGKNNIRVNIVFPGWHKSPLTGEAFPKPESCQDHLLGHTPDLQETADHIYQLTTAKNISGQLFNFDNRIF